MARVEVGAVVARLGFNVDETGARRYEQQIKRQRAEAAKPITQKLDVDTSQLKRAEEQAERTRRLISEKKAVVEVGANVAELKKDLAESKALVKEYDDRINASENNRTKAALRGRQTRVRAIMAEKEAELKAAREVLEMHRDTASALDTEIKQHRQLDAIESKRDRLAAAAANRRARLLSQVNRETERQAKAEERASEARMKALQREEEQRRKVQEERRRNIGSSLSAAWDDASPNLGARLGSLSGSATTILRITVALVPLATSVAGAITALAGSFTLAAAGAGALATSLASVVVPLGIVGAGVVARLGVISEAWQALSNQQDSAASDAEAAADRERAAAERVETATESLSEARRSEQDALEDLSEARFQAQREVEDLAEAVEDAALREKSANLSLREAITNLRELRLDPDADHFDIERAQLAVAEARDAVSDSERDGARAREDNARGTETLKVAEDRLTDARRARRRQEDELKEAIVSQTDALNEQSSSAKNVDTALGKLTETERRLLVQAREFADAFTAAMRPATDAIFGSVITAIGNIEPLLGRFEGRFKQLGTRIGDVFEDASESLAGREWTDRFDALFSLANKLVGPLTRALGEFAEILVDIAIAAGPMAVDFAKDFARWLGRISDAVGDVGKTRGVIRDMVDHTKSWVDFLGQALELVYRVFNGGASEGKGLLDRITDIVREWNKFLETEEGQERMDKFFRDAVRRSKELVGFIRGFVDGFKEALEPVKDVAKFMGRFVSHLLGMKETVSDMEAIGRIVGIIAVARLAGVTRFLSLLIAVGKNSGPIRSAFASLAAGGAAALGFRRGGGGGGGAGGAASSAAAGAAGGAAASAGGTAAGTAAGSAATATQTVGSRVRGFAKGARRVAGRLAAIDFAINLLDSKGNPIQAVANTASDLTFGITPRLNKVTPEDQQRVEKEAADQARRYSEAYGNALKPPKLDEKGFAISDEDWAKQQARTKRELYEQSHSFEHYWDEITTNLHKNWETITRNTDMSMGDIKRAVQVNGRIIKNRLGKDTKEGKDALAENFQLAAKAVAKQMDRGVISTRDGMKLIRGYLKEELQLYGFTISQARIASRGRGADGQLPISVSPADGSSFGSVQNTNQRGGRVNFATGGWLGMGRGSVGPDSIKIGPDAYAASGEYLAKGPGGAGAVLNRWQVPVIEEGLGVPLDVLPKDTRALPIIEGALGGPDALDSIFAAIDRPHMFAGGGRFFARGGLINGAIRAANQFERAGFPYLWGGGHQSSPTRFGPVDCSGAVSYVLQQAGVNIPTMVSGQMMNIGKPGPGPITIFADPGHVLMRIGSRYFGTSNDNPGGGAGWIDPGPDQGYLSRFAVRHFGAGDFSGFPGGGGSVRVPVPKVKGGGAVGDVVRGSLRLAAKSAQKMSSRAMSKMGVGGGQFGDFGVARGNGANLMRKISKQRGWNFADWWEIDRRETGHGTNLVNEGSGAFNRAQFMPGITAGHYGPGSLPGASMTEQIRSMAMYIAERYGNPTAARAFHDAHNWYKKGARWGRKRFYQGGGRVTSGPSGLGSRGSETFIGTIPEPVSTGNDFPQGPYKIGLLRNFAKKKIRRYERVTGQIEKLRTDYEYWDRRFGQSDEEYIDEETGEVNQKAVRKRVRELDKLMRLRQKIIDKMKEAREVAKNIRKSYATIIRKLKRSLRHAKKKDRKGIKDKITTYEGEFDLWAGNIGQLKEEIRFAGLDMRDIKLERAEVLGTQPEKDDKDDRGDPDRDATLEQAFQRGFVAGRTEYIDFNTGAVIGQAGDPLSIGFAGSNANRFSGLPTGGRLSRAAFVGGGDINAGIGMLGGGSGGVTVVNNISTLHPADPTTLSAIGKASAAGISYQGNVQTPRVYTGA